MYDDIKKTLKYITLKIYQDNSKMKFDSYLKKRSFDLDEEVKFCNDNLYNLAEPVEILKEGYSCR